MDGILLIDGYNVISSWPEFKDLKEADLAHARDRLIAILSEFRAFCGMRVIVVFDAHQVKGGTEQCEQCQGIEVVYTKEGETADNWIEKFAARQRREGTPGKPPLFVVTYDWLEQRIISAQGAYRITPEELRREIQRAKEEGKRFFQEACDRIPLDYRLPDSAKKLFENWRRRKTPG
ncbi:MAG: uncharacterized protein PWQ99_1175 [Clostridia bacterium]|uniref:NYN domain-containing protein n=1 Tax=Thermacetogenium phaeum TaxID=85874 RepID=A0A117LBB4_9THEO|nr:MAG: Uncharacterized protein XD66_0602 [Thermacetogenium phaeum]MDK2881400.1 uncharacterized protein [Clostridia bacterium]MDN5365189.1 uncharacterized protein [Thermacetogenium sp.]MDN5376643.1 uncharacterized protein [Thermacetogenium sp.]